MVCLSRNRLAPVSSKRVTRPDQSRHSRNAQYQPDDSNERTDRIKIENAKYLQPRQTERCDYREQQSQALHQMRLCIALDAYSRHCEVDYQRQPESVYEPNSNRVFHTISFSTMLTSCHERQGA